MNHTALNYPPGVDQAIHDRVFADSNDPDCTFCGRPISCYDTASVEIVDTRTPGESKYFCDNGCRSNHVYAHTLTTSGRAALMRFVAACQLLADEDVLSRAPSLKRYEVDEVEYAEFPEHQRVSISEFREMALSFLKTLGGPEGVDWAVTACALSDSLSTLAEKAAR